MINNRQNGRRRGRGGNQRPGGGGQGQRDNGNRIDSRARGNAPQLLEKYKNLARDAQMSGDRVNTEYYLQFADHYFRVLADQRGRTDDQPQQRRQRDDFDQFDDDDFGDEGEPIRAEEQTRYGEGDGGQRRDRNARDGQQQPQQRDGGRGEQQRDTRREQARDGGRDTQRDNGQRDGAQRDTGRDGGYQAGGRDSGARDGYRETARDERGGAAQDEAAPDARRFQPSFAPANDAEPSAPAAPVEAEVAPRRRGRPRKVRDEDNVAVADVVVGLEADRLPPSIGVPAADPAADAGAEEAPKPRRRRVRSATTEASSAG